MPNRPYEGASAPVGNPLEPAPPATAELQVRYPWAVKCDSCGWVDSFATEDEAGSRAAKHGQEDTYMVHLVRVVQR